MTFSPAATPGLDTDSALEATTRSLAGDIAANAPLTVRAAKRTIDELTRNPQTPDIAALDAAVAVSICAATGSGRASSKRTNGVLDTERRVNDMGGVQGRRRFLQLSLNLPASCDGTPTLVQRRCHNAS